ncbi:MAG: SPASM domain-containing protein [Planctomycetes bacterium]|nr:SPASM domain-containing protein [Planctomycetota bacterium]
MRAIKAAIADGLTVQINTTISRWNLNDIDNLCALMQSLGLTLWSAFFLVPTGRGEEKDEITPQQYEQVLEKLYQTAKKAKFDFKATSAPHYRRIVLQHQRDEGRATDSMRFVPPEEVKNAAHKVSTGEFKMPAAAYASDGQLGGDNAATGKDAPPPWVMRPMLPGAWERGDGIGRAARGVNDGNGFIFIDHHGEVYPSGFLPLKCGNVKEKSIVDIYRDQADLKRMRDFSQLKGKCFACDYRDVCGGARSRSYAVTGDYMASEPYCTYVPPALAHVKDVDWLSPAMLVADVRPYMK